MIDIDTKIMDLWANKFSGLLVSTPCVYDSNVQCGMFGCRKYNKLNNEYATYSNDILTLQEMGDIKMVKDACSGVYSNKDSLDGSYDIIARSREKQITSKCKRIEVSHNKMIKCAKRLVTMSAKARNLLKQWDKMCAQ